MRVIKRGTFVVQIATHFASWPCQSYGSGKTSKSFIRMEVRECQMRKGKVLHWVERHHGVGCQFSWNESRSGVHGTRQGIVVGHAHTFGVVALC